jgi:putative ABC transport system ATP-binding protein
VINLSSHVNKSDASQRMTELTIRLQGINKTYQVGDAPLRALWDVTLDIQQGEYISVMGPSGSGKSTLLNMIGLLDRPDSGEYWLKGTATVQLAEEQRALLRRAHIGFVFQSFHLIPRLTAFENVELPLMLDRMEIAARRNIVSDALTQLGLDDRMHHLPRQLSGGQLQRVAIARALVTKPAILLADEPTGNLDQKSGRDVMQVLEDLNQRGITLIVVTHDQSLGDRARRRIRMVDGRIDRDEEVNGET